MTPFPSRPAMALFGATILVGAFLLFQVQLVIAKYILPWYGGVPAVWTTCMLFFQLLLLAGYAYAHLLVRRLPAPGQRLLHLSVLVGALAVLGALTLRWGAPLLPAASWKPTPDTIPIAHIVALLAVAVGGPYFVVATTAPLIQAWFAARYPTASPYRLYALSNAGSLLALLTYPAVVEVWLPLRAQAWVWTLTFTLFAGGVVACALVTRRADGPAPDRTARRAVPAAAAVTPASPRAGDWLTWTLLAAVPSALLLATTNYMSQEIAVIPLLWIAPLSAYLLSFVLTFDSDRWYARGMWAVLLAVGITLTIFVLERGVHADLLVQIGVAEFALFAACMVCHGELARLKPAATHLTAFYLALTVGGALGGAAVALVAPLVFPGTWEYPLGLLLVGLLAVGTLYRDATSPLHTAPARSGTIALVCALAAAGYVFRGTLPLRLDIPDVWLFGVPVGLTVAGIVTARWRDRRAPCAAARRRSVPVAACIGIALVVTAAALTALTWLPFTKAVRHSRSFYGTVYVEAVDREPYGPRFVMRHGRIVHGYQYRSSELARTPTSYFGNDSGIGLAIEYHPRRATGLRLGVLGLGVGTIAAYGRPGDTIRFYELDPHVAALAGRDGDSFTYVRDSPAQIAVVIGDGRLALEAELARGEPQRFDILAIDAFSSDAVPAHLLTREAVDIYLAHLDYGGVLAMQITNRYVDLRPVIRGLASHFGLGYVFVRGMMGSSTYASDWALLARDPAPLRVREIADGASIEPSSPPRVLWTDDYSNVFALLKR